MRSDCYERSKLLIYHDGEKNTQKTVRRRRPRRNYWPIISVKATVRTILFFPSWRLLRAKRVKPSQRHSTLRGMDAHHHVLRALNPNASHLRATTASLAECAQLQQHHSELAADRASELAADRTSELAADRARDRARADAQRQDEQDRVRERLRSTSRRQLAGGVERERERKSTVRRRQSAGDVGRERK